MLLAIIAFALGAVGGVAVSMVFARRAAAAEKAALLTQAEAVLVRARAEADGARRQAELAAREASLAARSSVESEVGKKLGDLVRREERAAQRLESLPPAQDALEVRQAALAAAEQKKRAADERGQAARAEAGRVREQARLTLERVAGATAAAVTHALVEGWVENVRAEGQDTLRRIDASAADPEHGREAKRIIGIAIGRYQGHYLTERLLTNLPLLKSTADKLVAGDNLILHAIEEGANIKLTLHETGEGVRLEGQDSIGREIARRVIRKIEKNAARELDRDPPKFVANVKEHLDREIVDLGRRAFQDLELPRAHPEIVKLVGILNWRTSYTQNQWKHATEAAWLAGMIAYEMRLDPKISRRATLLHDIGKALTHAIDGSHAVIGADYCRRLGEHEIVSNAVGAHHGEEPCNSTYAHICAACDAMSGGRPGARREQSDNYVTKLGDLERIGGNFRGVERAYAVQGGRELRVYVKEADCDDLRAVELSSEIAKQISDEMTFPGQIKVTVIRQVQAVSVAS